MRKRKILQTLPKALVASIAFLTLLTALTFARPFGQGDHYFFELDEDGWSIVEPGELHRKIYVSNSTGSDTNDGLTELTPKKTIAQALKVVREGSSDWVLLKRGDTFPNGGLFDRPGGINNELGTADDPLHPQVFGAYGTGARPVLVAGIRIWYGPIKNLVIRDISLEISGENPAIDFLSDTTNILFENVRILYGESRIQGNHVRTTLYRCSILDAGHESPVSDSGLWGDDYTQNYQNRSSGLYVSGVTSFYMRECVMDHCGWGDGYNAIDGGLATDPQPPSMFSHNLYVGSGQDLTFVNNISTRGASMGYKLVAAGVVAGNVAVGNNMAMGINDGDQSSADPGLGDVLLLRDNVVLHASDKNATWIGARGWGLTLGEPDSILDGEAVRNIEAHSTASGSNKALSSQTWELGTASLVLDNVVYNYGTAADLDPDPANPYSAPSRDIISYNVSVGGAANLDDFYDEIRALERDNWNPDYLAKNIVAYLQDGFDIGLPPRTATTVAFTGNAADGFRWDNPDNWSTLDVPGTVTGDSASINGDYVNFGDSVTLSYLTLSNGAELDLFLGSLYLTDSNSLRTSGTGGIINLGRTGKLSWDRYSSSSPFTLNMTGGEFTVRGRIHYSSTTNITANISGGRAVLAGYHAWSDFSSGRSLNITGTKARVGWRDGGSNFGNIIFGNDGVLSFTFDELGVSPIEQIDGGAINAWFTIDTGAELHIDLTGLTGLAPGSYTNLLVNSDNLRGTAGQFTVENITGIGSNGITAATVEYDYATDDILLHITVGSASFIDFGSAGNFSGFEPGNQDFGTVTVSSDGGTNNVAKLAGNAWKTFGITETIDSTTRVRFSLKVTGSPEIVGIALGDSGDTVINDIIGQGVQLYGDGTQDTWFNTSAKNTSVADWYAGAGAYVQYDMLVSDFASPGSYTQLIFVADDDAGTGTEVFIKDIEFY